MAAQSLKKIGIIFVALLILWLSWRYILPVALPFVMNAGSVDHLVICYAALAHILITDKSCVPQCYPLICFIKLFFISAHGSLFFPDAVLDLPHRFDVISVLINPVWFHGYFAYIEFKVHFQLAVYKAFIPAFFARPSVQPFIFIFHTSSPLPLPLLFCCDIAAAE